MSRSRPGWSLNDDVETMPCLLQEAGYETAVFGVQHLGATPNNLGYEFMADHGIAVPRSKRMCYDPGVETALIARYPRLFEDGTIDDSLLSDVDLMPTILDIAGVDIPDDVTGRSFLPLVNGGEYDERERISVEMTFHDKYNSVRGVRTSRL